LAMSLDQIGPIGKNVYDCALLLDVIKGKDEYDSISVESPKLDLKNLDKNKKFIIGVLDLEIQNKEIKKLIDENIEKVAEKNGWNLIKVKIPYIDLAVETYYPIVYTEFFSATRKFDGRRYGKKIEDACGAEVLRRLLGGSEITKSEHKGRYYHLALRVKDFISKEFEKVFNEVDIIVSPTVPQLPYKIGEKLTVEEIYDYDLLTIPANLFGGCAISIPCGKIKGVPVGMQVMGNKFDDQKVLNIASLIEKELKI
jgi:aspartyl-tRNA(Asn)/glutamyl-tRNA(Gln) amidotransferase subunit A